MSDYWYDGGRPASRDTRAMVFLHGAGMDHTVWTLYARYFARRGWRVIAPDLPGHGHSGGAPLGSIGEQADWVAALLEREGAVAPMLVGHSMGSLIAVELAARESVGCSSLALLGSAAPMPVGAPLLDAAERNDHLAIDLICQFGHALGSQFGGNPLAGVNILNSAVRLLERAGPGVLHADLSACNACEDTLARAAAVRAPATVAIGAQDRMTPPRAARALCQALPDCRTIDLSCGHMMMSEAPEETLLALLSATRRAPPAGTPS